LAGGIVLAVVAAAEAQYGGQEHVDVGTGVALSVAATAPLVLSRRFPALAAGIVCAATVGLLALYMRPPTTGIMGQLLVIYVVTARYSRTAGGLALLPLAGNAVYPYNGEDVTRPVALLLLCLGLVAAALGDARRQRGRVTAERDETRRQIAEVRRDQAALTERSRIARELHDVVAHHVSMMVIRAETARVGTPGLPPAAGESLTAIRDTGRQALSEMRRLLGVLRADPADRHPQPGLGRLDELVNAARAAGTDVHLRWQGPPRAVPDGVQLCAYRIIQEALTNVRRHAPGATAEVLLRYIDHALQVSVSDDGPGPADSVVDGHGMLGMRERAATIGGTLRAGSAAGGGFLIEADLPTGGPA
jgi:signal transduction histidine kinase